MAGIDAFDTHFQEYERWFSDHGCVYRSELRAVGHLLPAVGKGLEVGVGSGKFAEPFGIKFGVEPSRAMRRLAESRGIEVCGGTAEELPFGDAQFDFVLMVTTLCFLDDADRSLQEVRRVLRNGGVIVVGFVDKDSPLGRHYREHKEENPFYREATFYSTVQVLDLLQRTGFAQAQVIQTVFGQLGEIHMVQEFKSGWGEGGFVVIRACKIP